LAAAMLLLSRWTPDRPLVDPCCGSGTFPIEAALLARRIAPGLRRKFQAEGWPQIPAHVWSGARVEAEGMVDRGTTLDLTGSDLDPEAIALSEEHAREAGVPDDIRWETKPVGEVTLPLGPGCVICNPPYGERLGAISAAERLYRELGRLYKSSPGWAFHVLSAHPDFERFFGRRAPRARKLYNGRLECQFLSFPSSQSHPGMV
jgi:putative N6-adenine-specific DNA methylase